jgi:sugar phosphate isomerase/epimerase
MAMILNRLGVLTDEVSANLIEALDWAAEQGLAHVEIRMVDGNNVVILTDQQVEQVRREVEKRGLFVSVIASPLFKCALDPSRPVASGDTFGQAEEDLEAHFAKLHRTIEFAKSCKRRTSGCFRSGGNRNPAGTKRRSSGICGKRLRSRKKKNMLLLLENEPSCNGGYASEVASLVQRVNSTALRVLWDPGNEEYGGRPAFPEGYEQVKRWLGIFT